MRLGVQTQVHRIMDLPLKPCHVLLALGQRVRSRRFGNEGTVTFARGMRNRILLDDGRVVTGGAPWAWDVIDSGAAPQRHAMPRPEGKVADQWPR